MMTRITLLLLLLLAVSCRAEEIVVGKGSGASIGWQDGICYPPVTQAWVGDVIRFDYFQHDVYKMASRTHFDSCDFSDALLMSGVGQGPYEYTIKQQDVADGSLYFACSVGSHCVTGNQRIQIQLEPNFQRAKEDNMEGIRKPVSHALFGKSPEECAEIQNGAEYDATLQAIDSECSEPELDENGYYHRSCLSPRATLTPGGVINNMYILNYPYPKDRRVKVGLRTWEFVMDDPGNRDGPVIVVPQRQLYVHHIAGSVVLGQGNEGIRRDKPDAPFPHPYAVVTGNDDEFMNVHIIDLREVGDDWLPCIECRCKDGAGSYLDFGGGGDGGGVINEDGTVTTGGISCCTNCTDLTGPTIDYRLRYNVSYAEIGEEPVKLLDILLADISPAVSRVIEFDVPHHVELREEFRKENEPEVQRLVREMPFNELFLKGFFGFDKLDWPSNIRLFRCVGHLHIAALGMWLEDAETGETLCSGTTTYGQDPGQDLDILTAIHVDTYDTPKEFPPDRKVRFITEYNATELHTGVMGLYFVFVDAEKEITAQDADLRIDVCHNPVCDVSMLPQHTSEQLLSSGRACEDTLADSPACTFAGFCDCDAVIANVPEGETACDYTFESEQGGLEVKRVCAKTCGCPSTTCADLLPSSPICSMGGICDCEAFVNHEKSTGCGGVFASGLAGDIPIDDVCAAHCDACPKTTEAEVISKEFAEKLEDDLDEACQFSTPECRALLNNALSCSLEMPGLEAHEQVLRRAAVAHAGRLALKYSKLGSPSLHRALADPDPADILSCEELAAATSDTNKQDSGAFLSSSCGPHFALVLALVALALAAG